MVVVGIGIGGRSWSCIDVGGGSCIGGVITSGGSFNFFLFIGLNLFLYDIYLLMV